MPFAGRLSFIYTSCHHNAKAFYPPARASNPQTPVYMNLQPPRRTARTSLHSRWALTPPSHPYLHAGGYFLLRYSAFTNSFLLGSGVLCAARTFLLCTKATATDRSTAFSFTLNLLQRYDKEMKRENKKCCIFVAENQFCNVTATKDRIACSCKEP